MYVDSLSNHTATLLQNFQFVAENLPVMLGVDVKSWGAFVVLLPVSTGPGGIKRFLLTCFDFYWVCQLLDNYLGSMFSSTSKERYFNFLF